MKRSFLSMMLAALALPTVAGCPGEDTGTSVSEPYRDEWRTVIDQPFATEGDGAVTSIQIGSTGVGSGAGNFHNRGDVIVQYHDSDRILVEMRKFTMAESQELADDDFDKLSIWGSTGSLPNIPYNLSEEDNCVDPNGEMAWQSGCTVAVFYDGQQQAERSGADLRVTLPRTFIYDLTVETEDNAEDSDYQNRGNVCIEGLPGSADVSLSNGTAWVILDESMPEMPECPDMQRIPCEESNWDTTTCGCLINDFSFSQVKVASNDAQSTDVFVDIPSGGDFWVAHNLRNDGENEPGDETPGALCESVVDGSAGTVTLNEGIDLGTAPNVNQGMINYPGEPATPGAGFSIQASSDSCQVVSATEDPDNFVGLGMGSEQKSEERGNLTICAGCLRNSGCADLIPGL